MAEPKKQIPLRLNAKLYDALAAWAEDDFRSVNGQIEYLLTECVRQRKKNGRYVSDQKVSLLSDRRAARTVYQVKINGSTFFIASCHFCRGSNLKGELAPAAKGSPTRGAGERMRD